MRRCLELNNKALEKGEIPISAVVVKDGQVIGEGINMRKADCDPSAHAEIVAIREAGKHLGTWNLSGCNLVVTLEPCAMCSGAVVNSRIDNVYFGGYDIRFGYAGSLGNIATDTRLNHNASVTGGILADECLAPIKDFFAKKRQAKKDSKQDKK